MRIFVQLSLWGLFGGLGSLFLGMLLLLFVVASILAPLSTPSLAHAAGQSPAGVTHEWRGPRNQSVVNEALYVASGLYDGPPDSYDTWYVSTRIPDAIVFWQADCPGCHAWAKGNLQCVMLVTAAYGLAHQPLPYVGDAITFWTSRVYASTPGWEMLPPSAIPYPGDLIVLSSPFFGGVGHIVVVVDVQLPSPSGKGGYVQFVEANGPGALVQMPLVSDGAGGFTMAIWPHYTVLGSIRHTAFLN